MSYYNNKIIQYKKGIMPDNKIIHLWDYRETEKWSYHFDIAFQLNPDIEASDFEEE
jgi:hypothetical protein